MVTPPRHSRGLGSRQRRQQRRALQQLLRQQLLQQQELPVPQLSPVPLGLRVTPAERPLALAAAPFPRPGDMSLLVSGGGLMGVGVVPSASSIPTLVSGATRRGDTRRRDSGDSPPKSPHSAGSSSEEHSPNKIFVGGISFQTTPEKLRAYFAPYGTILDVMVLKDPATNRNRGFGFVTFADVDSVNKVLGQEEHMLDGKKIDPKLATPKGQKSSGELLIPRKVFVGGVSQETSSQELLEYFSQFGKVLECSLQMDNNTKRHRGFAFVTFADEEHSARVVKKHHHVVKSKTVECKYAQPKETIQATERARRAQLMSVMQSAAGAIGPLAPLAAVQAQQHYSRVMSAAAGGSALSALSGFRYSPYSLPGTATGAQQLGQLTSLPQQLSSVSQQPFQGQTLPQLQQLQQLQTAAAGAPTATAYPFTNLDVPSLQGLEWSGPLYGMYSA